MRRIAALVAATALLAGCPALLPGLTGGSGVSGKVTFAQSGNAFLGPDDSYRIASFATEVPMPKATVKISDTTNADIGVASVTTDSSGNFSFDKVPSGKTLILFATKAGNSGSTIKVAALWASGATRNLDTVSTMLVDKITSDTSVAASKLASLSEDKIDAAEAALNAAVGSTATVPDLTSSTDAAAKFDSVAASASAVASAYAELKQ